MSNRYKGGVISATPPTTTGGNDGVASGAWTLEQQMQLQAAGLWPNQPVYYIEDVFSTYLYTATGPSAGQTITNGIDLSTKGGMVWIKNRTTVGTNFATIDTVRGATKEVYTDTNGAQSTVSNGLTAFTSSGFTLGIDTVGGNVNYAYTSPTAMVSWTFRKQAKFFDVVTYTGTGSNLTVNHNLGSAPGCIIIKDTSNAYNWTVYHRSLATGEYLVLNSTGAKVSTGGDNVIWNVNSTSFNVASYYGLSYSGDGYVAYLFAHDAGGFGLTGSDNVISCGSFTTDPSTGGATVNLGYEPQWLLVKSATSVQGWHLIDNMRGMANLGTYGDAAFVEPNTSSAESTGANCYPTANGFWYARSGSTTYIYIAIRRGPMKVPTSGTSVFEPKTMSATQANLSITGVGFPPDLVINGVRSNANYGQQVTDRLRGVTQQVFTEYDSAENTTNGTAVVSLNMNGISLGADTAGTGWNAYSGYTSVKWMFGRAPSFFDEVCYRGTGVAPLELSHNLGAVPELMIVKNRTSAYDWFVYSAALGNNSYLRLNTTAAVASNYYAWADTTPTSTKFTVGALDNVNGSVGFYYVAYLFATCAGVSKVGSYTGTGALQTINCGFAAGARFVLIKRTDSTGDWYTYDSARGISSSNDPYLLLNSAAAEVTGTNYVDTTSVGFQVTAAAPAAINANGGTFIFLAIA